MNHPIIPIAVQGASRQRKRQAPKGRRVEPQALAEVQALLGDESRQADLLIEHLHKIQDRYGCLSAQHLAALAQEMRLAQTEVYEVATFYHHFDVVKEGEAAPAALTVRVCDGLSCEMAGARDLLDKLPAILGRDVRVVPSPCIGRCEQAPAARGRTASGAVRDYRSNRRQGRGRRDQTYSGRLHRPGRLPRQRRLRAAARLRRRRARRRIRHRHDGRLRPARPWRRRLPAGPQMAHRAQRSRRRA